MHADRVIELIYAFCFGLAGVSHIVQARAWSAGLAALCRSPWAGFIIAGYTLPIAVLGAFGHSWLIGIGLVVPIVGAAMLVKCVIYALAPRTPNTWACEMFLDPRKIRAAGVVCLVIAALCVVAAV